MYGPIIPPYFDQDQGMAPMPLYSDFIVRPPCLHTRSIFCIFSGWISYYSTHWKDMRTGDNNASMYAFKTNTSFPQPHFFATFQDHIYRHP